ncbi:hypothetical protein J2S00_000571 [Caldalkalibacillus uzonensis]|uniref:Uncharacterized protein n=1 Tax=Caldalkalibacillus uzonensis TaxID=353224 RepID=A0ABU0CPI2_9BACI|nr:hypothetical protein [Caldalkalibacillus uzonensis]
MDVDRHDRDDNEKSQTVTELQGTRAGSFLYFTGGVTIIYDRWKRDSG